MGPSCYGTWSRGGEATGQGAGDGGGRVEDDAGVALPGMHLDSPTERKRRPRVQMLRELLQGDGW